MSYSRDHWIENLVDMVAYGRRVLVEIAFFSLHRITFKKSQLYHPLNTEYI